MYVYKPPPSLRTSPARTSSLCEAISASAGLSLSVGIKNWDQSFMEPATEAAPAGWRKFICEPARPPDYSRSPAHVCSIASATQKTLAHEMGRPRDRPGSRHVHLLHAEIPQRSPGGPSTGRGGEGAF